MRLRLLKATGVQHAFLLARGESGDASSIARALGAIALFDGGAPTGDAFVESVPSATIDGERVSSQRLCRLISAGDLDAAYSGLGRRHAVEGRVVHGFHRGAPLGIPTANLRLRGVALPPDGVYAVRARVGATELQGVANIGFNPTFGNTVRSVETHLLDFAADLYGRRLEVAFVRRLRGEQRFAGIDALLLQIQRDIASAREIFATIDV
jgi:riboflavin kinase/FMN adenylyltransferase